MKTKELPMGNKPPWDMYPNAWRTGSDLPEDPPNYCMLCDRGTVNRQFCDACLAVMDDEQRLAEEWDDEPDYEAMAEAQAEARDDRGPHYG
jgi:hypothetical protein